MSKEIRLQKPNEKGVVSLEEALNHRRSIRSYKKGPLSLEEVSQLLWAASGRNIYRRTAPSAGATYPLEVYLVSGEVTDLGVGLYHYFYSLHSLKMIKEGDMRKILSQAGDDRIGTSKHYYFCRL